MTKKLYMILIALLISTILAAMIVYAQDDNQPTLTITNPKTLNENGEEQSVFERGDVVIVQATVNYESSGGYYYYAPGHPVSFLYIVQIRDPSGEYKVYYGVVYDTLEEGESGTYAVGWGIPMNAQPGTYTAHIFVWSNWPGEGDTWTSYDSTTITFEIRV